MRLHVSVVGALGLAVLTAGSVIAAPVAYDRPGRNELVSVDSNGRQAQDSSRPNPGCGGLRGQADISGDGRYVMFAAPATNLVPHPDPAQMCHIFWRDRRSGITRQIDVASDGSQPIDNPLADGYELDDPSFSADGRWVAFRSRASNLVPGDTNLAADIFLHDTRTAKTRRVSVGPRGVQANGASAFPSVSRDGRYVAFASRATNLVTGDTNGEAHTFVFDTKTGKVRLVSVSSKGVQGAGASDDGVSISANGRYVAFGSDADNLVPGDTTNELYQAEIPEVFRHDLKTGKTIRVSVASDGSQASFAVFPICEAQGLPICGSSLKWTGGADSVSDDGRFVRFMSNATNLVPNDTNYRAVPEGIDVFVHDAVTRRTERVSVDSYGQESPENSHRGGISGDGRNVTFFGMRHRDGGCARRVPLVGVEAPVRAECDTLEAYLYDRVSGAREQLSLSVSGRQPTGGTCDSSWLDDDGPAETHPFGLSRDGRYVALYSDATDLVRGDTNDRCDYFVRDRGRALGVGGFGGTGSGGPNSGGETCVEGVCLPLVVQASGAPGDAYTGADLIGARAVPRAGLRDLFVRLDLAHMPAVAGTPAGGVLYGMRFTAGGQRYEVRVQRVPGADFDPKGGASFGLFRQDALTGLFTKVAALNGGYGTTGHSVVVVVPLKELGVASGGRLSDVRAFTGVGSYLTGATKVLDTVRLAR